MVYNFQAGSINKKKKKKKKKLTAYAHAHIPQTYTEPKSSKLSILSAETTPARGVPLSRPTGPVLVVPPVMGKARIFSVYGCPSAFEISLKADTFFFFSFFVGSLQKKKKKKKIGKPQQALPGARLFPLRGRGNPPRPRAKVRRSPRELPPRNPCKIQA